VATYLFDSSAIVKRYINEIGSGWVIGLTDPTTGNHIHVARVTGVEVISAITRQGRSGSLSPAGVATALTDFRYDFTNQYEMVEITPRLLTSAMNLAEAHALRGYDAVQLAAAVHLNARRLARRKSPLTFVSADADLNAAALAEGLAVDDPNNYP
jgi:predicted nucleic acid-binding protein